MNGSSWIFTGYFFELHLAAGIRHLAMPSFKMPDGKVPKLVKSGIILVVYSLIGFGIAVYAIHLALSWPQSGQYLGIVKREDLKSLLDTASAILTGTASLGLLIVAAFGLQTLRLAKLDLKIRSQREAKTIAIHQTERFAKEIIPASGVYLVAFAKNNIQPFDYQMGGPDFKPPDSSLLMRAQTWVGTIPLEVQGDCIKVLNMLESWAMNFNQRIADSGAAYRPCSDIFCRTVIQLYPLILLLRRASDPELFSNIEELFKDWQGRKQGKIFEAQERALAQNLALIRKMAKQKPHPKSIGE